MKLETALLLIIAILLIIISELISCNRKYSRVIDKLTDYIQVLLIGKSSK